MTEEEKAKILSEFEAWPEEDEDPLTEEEDDQEMKVINFYPLNKLIH